MAVVGWWCWCSSFWRRWPFIFEGARAALGAAAWWRRVAGCGCLMWGRATRFWFARRRGKIVLVDAGVPGSGRVVLDALRRLGAPQVDLLVATHAHADHIGGADEVIRAIKVLRVLDSTVPNATKNYEDFLSAIDETQAQYVGAAPGQTFDLGDGVVLDSARSPPAFLHQRAVARGRNEPNANSVVTRLDYGDFSMLLTGDAEAQTEERILTNNGNVRASVLKVGHHGSRYATSEELLRAGRFKGSDYFGERG
ncbi:MAG: MBL fold metallo-hydrolase [Pyrinomonadaceae bacterium]